LCKPSDRKEEIIERVLGLAVKHREMGISANSRIICRHCRRVKPLIGAISYGRYRLCNNCALQYEVAMAEGKVNHIEDFVIE